jgi:hypothetical protein
MEATLSAPTPRARLAGRAVTALPALFLAFDAAIKIVQDPHAIEATTALGVPPELLAPIGALELACLALYVIPRTAPLGETLLTGFLGGPVVLHLRLGHPLPTHTLFPVYVGALCWLGLYLRDARVRALVAPTR